MRKSLAAGVVAAALVGGAATTLVLGPVLADAQEAEETESDAPRQPPWVTEALDGLVADGVIDQGQADAVAEALADARPGPPPWAGGPHGEGGGPGWGPGRGHGPGLGPLGRGLDTAAEVIGVEESVVVEGLRSGQSLAEIAAANGSSAQAVIDALVAEAHARIDEEVAEGDLDAAEADARRAEATERITALVNGELPAGPGRGWGHGHGGDGGDDEDAEPPAEPQAEPED